MDIFISLLGFYFFLLNYFVQQVPPCINILPVKTGYGKNLLLFSPPPPLLIIVFEACLWVTAIMTDDFYQYLFLFKLISVKFVHKNHKVPYRVYFSHARGEPWAPVSAMLPTLKLDPPGCSILQNCNFI